MSLALQGAGAAIHHRTSHAPLSEELVSHGCHHHHHHDHDTPADEPDQPAPESDCPTCVVMALGCVLTLPAAPTPLDVILPTLSGVPPDVAFSAEPSPFVRSHPATGPPTLA